MRKILFPTNFGEASYNAFIFAERIAAKFGAEIDVVNIYDGLFDHNALYLKPESLQNRTKTITQKLEEFASLTPNEGGIASAVRLNYKVALTYQKNLKIIELARDYDFVVLGINSIIPAEKRVFGSFASSIIQNVTCPVLIVPKDAVYKGFDALTYASDWNMLNYAMIRQIALFARHFNAFVDFIDISDNKATDSIAFELLKNTFEQIAPKSPYSSTHLDTNFALKGLYRYLLDNDTDLLTIVNRKRGWYENLLGGSMTQELAIRTKTPILSYHSRQAIHSNSTYIN